MYSSYKVYGSCSSFQNHNTGGEVQVCLVQNANDVVSFPKGAQQNLKFPLETALREWEAETDYAVAPLDVDRSRVMIDGNGVHYFAAAWLGGPGPPGESWVPSSQEQRHGNPVTRAWWCTVSKALSTAGLNQNRKAILICAIEQQQTWESNPELES